MRFDPSVPLTVLTTAIVVAVFTVLCRLNPRRFGGHTARPAAGYHALNQVLATLVSNRELSEVLDSVARFIQDQIPGTEAGILICDPDGWRIAAAPGVRAAWLECLTQPHIVPFEAWKLPYTAMNPKSEPAWANFADAVYGELPGLIRTCRIGTADKILGTILCFHPACVNAASSADHDPANTLETTARLAQLAVTHSRSCEELNFRAHHDHLTSLPTREELLSRLESDISQARIHSRPLGALCVDLDNFNEVNDRFSHAGGDQLLREVARRLRRTLRTGDSVARVGADEFNVILPDLVTAREAEDVAARLLAVIREPFESDGRVISVTASAGVAMFPADASTADQLLDCADEALRGAKHAGKDRVNSYAASRESGTRQAMQREIRSALEDGRLVVHYQPKFMAGGDLAGFEALVRICHPQQGLIPPAAFIPAAESSGQIVQIGNWVLEEVCRQVVWWRDHGYGQIPVAVNASPVQLERPDFAESVEQCLARHGVPPWNIEIEVTESLVVASGGETIRQMRALRSMGIRFSIDDFGAGYSALGYLHQLPVDAIKLDRSFIQGIETSDAARRIVTGLIAVARGLGLNVVAEGVETDRQRSVLLAAGCPQMQGYFFAHPQPAAGFQELLLAQLTKSPPSAVNDLTALAGVTGNAGETVTDLAPVA